MTRKAYVRVPQGRYLEVARETGGGCIEDFAGLFDVSHATARAMLDGLVAQGKLRVSMAGTRLRFYEAADA